MFTNEYKWQHDYVRLAADTGFCFERHKSDTFDKNKINAIDVDRVIDERDFGTIEKIIPSISKFTIEQEQVQLLDTTFVKTFILSQLSIQYLLYCKKYLDNTVILLKDEGKKLKEENKELTLFVDDLKSHVSQLMQELEAKPTFKCNQCNKVFSTEEFLNSHIKRRHNFESGGDADRLQMEIKDLKGRLNDAEKKIQKDNTETDSGEFRKFEDLQKKFEELRLQVQSELKILQSQYNSQEKYEKLLEKMALGGSEKKGGGDFGVRRESTTQTDLHEIRDFHLQYDEINKENIPEVSRKEKDVDELGAALENKVASSLEKIEYQMQSFWDKLNEMEKYKNSMSEPRNETKAKPRSKYTMKNVEPEEKIVEIRPIRALEVDNSAIETDESEKIDMPDSSRKAGPQQETKPVIVKISEPKKQPEPLIVKTVEKEVSDEEIYIESSETEVSEDLPMVSTNVLKPLPAPRQQVTKPVKKKNTQVTDDDLMQHFKIEMEKLINNKLQDLGVSPEWQGLPMRSYKRALEIVNHQASLTKKIYPNFDFISRQIEENISKKLDDGPLRPQKVIKKQEPSPKRRQQQPSPKIEIKNRKIYDTDSESEIKQIKPTDKLKVSTPYSAVIEELKVVTSKIDDQTKGVLKSYPSAGSLTKKKVNFNLRNETKIQKDGGSTTSVASSVFDITPREKPKAKDMEDLSDLDFSDL